MRVHAASATWPGPRELLRSASGARLAEARPRGPFAARLSRRLADRA
jgi:hypothetical protein